LKRHPVRQRYRMVELQRWRDKRGLNFIFSRRIGPSTRGWPMAL
jgi:2-hydroxychromene-2-carboxylate isomerase